MPDGGRSLIVTGASSGIGRALALLCARDGYRVLLIARRSARLDEAAAALRDAGGTCATLAGDVTAPGMPARIVATALERFGRIDVLVNNAGRGAYGPLLEQSDADVEAQWQLHVAAPLRLARAALAHLERVRGQIVFIGSGAARVPLPLGGAYAPAKAAIRAAATQLRRELRTRGVAVTYVDPGVVATEFHAAIGIERTLLFPAAPHRAARAILRGIERRAAVVTGVPWQTAAAVAGEWLGPLADPIVIARFAARRVREPAATHGEPPRAPAGDSFDKALEPVARRMERVKLPADFLRTALVPGATIELNGLAMRWAGMPNKNERAVLRETLAALEAGGYLQHVAAEIWRVVRAAG